MRPSSESTKFYDVDAGIAHLVLMEAGHVAPGDLIVGTDSHCTIYGSLGALGTGIGYTEVASVWITGKLWMKVPESFKVMLERRVFSGRVFERPDAALDREPGRGWRAATNRWSSMARLPGLSVSERMTMTNLAMEMGVKCAFVPPDAHTAEYLRGRLKDPARYQARLARTRTQCMNARSTSTLDALEPMVACPHEVQNTKPIGQVVGTRIDQAFLGSCANAKYEDLAVAARILKGRRIHPERAFHHHSRIEERSCWKPRRPAYCRRCWKAEACSPIQAAAHAPAMAA